MLMFQPAAQAYDLFNPRPQNELRPLSPDRPGTTESPYTLDAGHFQLEWGALDYSYDTIADAKTDTLTSSVNLKAGLSDHVDVQLVLEPRTRVAVTEPGGKTTQYGRNDTQLRLKINLLGDDGGEWVFALLPFVQLPTHSSVFGADGKVQGGLSLPLAFNLPHAWSGGAMLGVNAVRNDDNSAYVFEHLETFTLSHDLIEHVSVFGEVADVADADHEGAHQTYFNTGLVWLAQPNLQLDAGANFGLSNAATDREFFVGISWRH